MPATPLATEEPVPASAEVPEAQAPAQPEQPEQSQQLLQEQLKATPVAAGRDAIRMRFIDDEPEKSESRLRLGEHGDDEQQSASFLRREAYIRYAGDSPHALAAREFLLVRGPVGNPPLVDSARPSHHLEEPFGNAVVPVGIGVSGRPAHAQGQALVVDIHPLYYRNECGLGIVMYKRDIRLGWFQPTILC